MEFQRDEHRRGKRICHLTLTNVQLTQAGSYAVEVGKRAGFRETSSNAILTVYTVPVITSFSPQSGAAGTVVNISGLNFDPTPGNNIVYFGAVQAAVTAASETNLVVTVPAGATYAPITETVNGLTAWSGSSFLVTYLGSGQIDASSLAAAGGFGWGLVARLVVIGDLDGDGKPDLVVHNGYSPSISIFRNISTNGSLTADSFAPRVDLPLEGPQEVSGGLALADLDGDGRLDIITSSSEGGKVSIFQNLCSPGTITTSSFGTRVDIPVNGGRSMLQCGIWMATAGRILSQPIMTMARCLSCRTWGRRARSRPIHLPARLTILWWLMPGAWRLGIWMGWEAGFGGGGLQ